ncbi:hypothetical protein ACX3YC_13685 [Pseudomonas mohnii]
MNNSQRDHRTAVTWIEGEIENLVRDLGKPNASAAATSAITLAFLLRAISDEEQRNYRARIDQIYATFNTSNKQGAAA